MLKKLFKWIFKSEIQELTKQISRAKEAADDYERTRKKLDNILSNIDVTVDVHEYNRYASSWAVISIQGERTDFVKFIDLGKSDIREIQHFLSNFDRSKVDASPQASDYLRIPRRR